MLSKPLTSYPWTSSGGQGAERRRTAYDKEFHARMRPLARYQPQLEHEAFVEGLLLEARLRTRILVRPFFKSPGLDIVVHHVVDGMRKALRLCHSALATKQRWCLWRTLVCGQLSSSHLACLLFQWPHLQIMGTSLSYCRHGEEHSMIGVHCQLICLSEHAIP